MQVLKTLTPAQILLLAAGVVGLFTGIAPLWLDPKTVATIGGSLITFLGVVGTAFTGQGAAVNSVVRNLDSDPATKKQIVAAVSGLKGVEEIKTNSQADGALASLAHDESIPKVT